MTYTNTDPAGRAGTSKYVRSLHELLGSRDPVSVLDGTPRALNEVVAGVPSGKLTQPETAGKWSVGAVIQHLADSDLVWAYRMRMVLGEPSSPVIVGYDQDSWAAELRYQDANAQEALEQFGFLRRMNVKLVRALRPDQLQRVGHHSERGPESVETMIRLFAGHDLVHLRQIERIKRAILR